MRNTVITKDITDLSNLYAPTTIPKSLKEDIVETFINPSNYEFIGFVDRSNTAILRPKYHNVRDSYGRFARAEETI
jgi:hypothetical protein